MTALHSYWPTEGEISRCIKTEAESMSDAALLSVHQETPLSIRNAGSSSKRATTEDELLDSFLTTDLPEGTLLLVITGASGARRVPSITYFKGLYETDLQEGEIVTAAHVPVLGSGERHAFDEITRRHGDYAMAGLAARASVSGTTFSNVRLAYFGVAGTPVLAVKAGAVLEGTVNDDCISAAQNALDSDLDPFDDIGCSAATKLHLAKVLLDRVVRRLVAGQ